MTRWLTLGVVLAAATALVPAQAAPHGSAGDAVIRGKAGLSEIVITTTARTAGAIHSLTWAGKEFLDSADHGRQLQSAAAFDVGDPRDFWAEAYNPTEAGSSTDGAGPRSSSQLVGLQARGNALNTITRMAFWLPPGGKSGTHPAKNTTPVSNHLLTKQVAIGQKQYAHAIDYKVTFSIPPTDPKHTFAQFEALTGYMPAEFGKFWTFDPKSHRLAPLSDGPGEQALPVVFSTENGLYAMGVWSPDQPSPGYATAGYGRFRFPEAKVVKWNCVFRVSDPKGIKPGNYTYQMFVAVGSLKNVQDTLAGVIAEFKK